MTEPIAMDEQKDTQNHRKYFWGNTPDEQDYYTLHNIKSTSSFFTSPRGLSLFTRSWLPLTSTRHHLYGPRLRQRHLLDLPIHRHLPRLQRLPCRGYDHLSFFTSIQGYDHLPRFLFGESMGGAICLLLQFNKPKFFAGAVLIAPMCKISDKVRPRWPIPEILMVVARFAPTLAIVPTEDLVDKSVKVAEKRITGAMNPMRYTGKPRLGTVVELLRVTEDFSMRLSEVEIPFIVLHGDADAVTDPEVSKELFEKAKSADKRLKVYDGMWHSLLFREMDENVEVVRVDILKWLNDRC